MDIRTLKYFVAVAEELNISKAAKRLCMSQPPLSNQMKALEYELNATLFIRGGRQLQLTDAGKLLYRRAKEIISLSQKAASEIRSLSEGMGGKISIGLTEGAAPSITAKLFKKFLDKYPNVKFKFIDGNSGDIIVRMRAGIVSMAIITEPYDHSLLNGFHVASESLTAFMSKDHPLAKKKGDTIDLEELADYQINTPSRKEFTDIIYKWYAKIGKEPNIICQMDNYLDVAALAENNVGVSIFPRTEYIHNPKIVTKKIVNPEQDIEYVFVWLKGRPLPTIEENFIDFVKADGEI